jgi:CubicO group peptidase (beta-lactamase class C family)
MENAPMDALVDAASPEAVGLNPAALDKIDALIAEQIAARQLPGAVTLVARHGKVVHRSVQGLKNLAKAEPVAFDTIFPIFSMTKPITAAAMMVLHDRGLWSPDDPIARHLPEFADVKGPDGGALDHAPTLRELMTHTAGFGYAIGLGPFDATDKAYLAAKIWEADSLADFSRRVASAPLAYQPGTSWRYSLSMDLQGAIIEKLSGQSLPDFMREQLFAPLGMVDTDFWVPPEKQPRLAMLYHMYGADELTELNFPGFKRDGVRMPRLPSGGGGLYATVGDYARFAQMLLNKGELDGARVIEASSIELMTANHLPQALIDQGFIAGAQAVKPGRGYAFNGAVFYDPAPAGSPVGKGTYQWDGAGGAWFWVDPEHDLLFVGLIGRMMQEGMTPYQAETQRLIAEGLG